MKTTIAPLLFLAAGLPLAALSDPFPFEASVARWQGDAKGCVSFYYDDGLQSHFDFAIPAHEKYGIPGTFYICFGWFENNPAMTEKWRAAAKSPLVVLGNHTYNHGGVTNVAQFAEELSRNDVFVRELDGLDENALVSFALPGAVAWTITPEEQNTTLDRFHSVLRHDFDPNICGAGQGVFVINRCELAVKMVLDRAESEGSWQSMLCHGVGGDWLTLPAAEHAKILREAAIRRDQGRLWLASTIAAHKYETERNGATLTKPEEQDGAVCFTLATKTDAKSYDEPLTVVLTVPAEWKSVRCAYAPDGGTRSEFCAPVLDGRVLLDLVPAPSAEIRVSKVQ